MSLRRFSRWIRPLGLGAILVVGVPAFLTLAPVPYHTSVAWNLSVSGEEPSCVATPNFTAPSAATLSFSWTVSSTANGSLGVYQLGANGVGTNQLYEQPAEANASGGSAAVSLVAGRPFQFVFCGANETATISGSLAGDASVVRIVQAHLS